MVKPGSSSASAAARPATEAKKPVPKPSNPYANYTTAANLGITDPDEERRQAEAERRRTQGVAGDWEVVSVIDPAAPAEGQGQTEPAVPEAGPSAGVKREAEAIPEHEDTRRFKLRKKTLGVGLGEIYDPGLIPIKVKKKEEPTSETPLGASSAEAGQSAGSSSAVAATSSGTAATEKPRWSARGWNRPGEGKADEHSATKSEPSASTSPEPTNSQETVKQALEPPPPPPQAPAQTMTNDDHPTTEGVAAKVEVKIEDPPVKVKLEADGATAAAPAGGSMFRKRKLPAGGAGSRGKRS